MSRPLTDREQVLMLQAKVAELEDELRAWRRDKSEDLTDLGRLARAIDIRDRLQPLDRRAALSAAAILMYLIDHPGAVVTKRKLVEASRTAGTGDHDPHDKIAAVQVNFLRNALREIGLGAAVETVWGVGFRVSAQNAARLKAWFDPEAADG